ncbi:FAD-dependent oxidoreductase [Nocardioides zeae]|uniref:FAD-dependent oxidoreductase n=1 Tax=Nocardioides imazamoxiresistens TaxID=3231893 RepID=A0ABU3PRX6_9ACTN|nr:FAD-dependent oxidoreductase [Nocardioides zeae]MDT9591627.1 FAD-dependent oxidoreductase [Nocardioides zeae]
MSTTAHATYSHIFSPVTVGTMQLRNRVMMPPHASAIGNIYGTDEEAARNIAYFVDRCRDDGPAWVGSLSTHVRNHLIPGFEPTGVGAATLGFFRLPFFVERVQAYCDALHALDSRVTVQMVHQGGMPHGASNVMSAPVINLMPHVMDTDDIDEFVKEYAHSARLAQEGRADGVELHLNHDDLHEWFLSPFTNRRTDAYGGSLENRARFAVECIRAIRDVVGTSMTVGVRLNIREEVPEGYGVDGGIELAQYLESTGLIDYVHGVVGSPWGNPSYIQPTYFDPAQYAELAGELRAAISLPVVHTGRINDPDVAERVLAAGHADVVGIARAHIADGDLLAKARDGRQADIRPCVGGNECISRRYVENLPFGCAVNPATSHEDEAPWTNPAPGRRLLVVGGGPAGMELAALATEGGMSVQLVEAADELGGQLRYVAKAPRHENYGKYLDWQTRRLAGLGVDVRLGTRLDADAVRAAGADVVAVATGAGPRRPEIRGVEAEHVLDVRDVLAGTASPGRRVLVVAQDDHVAPLTVADHLAGAGHEVHVVYATHQPAPLLGRYIIGGILGRLDAQDVQMTFMEEVVGIERHTVTTRNVYSWRERTHAFQFDSVVLACGSVADPSLYDALRTEGSGGAELHLLGDAYAPRRLVFATRQAWALAQQLVTSG